MSENYTFLIEVMEILLFCFQIQGTVNNQLLHSKIWKFSDLKFRCYINLETHQKNPITSETGRWSTFEALSSTSQIVKYTGTLIPIIKNDCILFKNTINFLLTFIYMRSKISSVQLSWSVMSDSLRTHEPQHTRPPCPRPSPTPGVYPNSCPLSWWCHPTISSSVIPFSPCLQSFPTSGSFPVINSSHQEAKVLKFQLQHQSFQWTPRTDLLEDGLVGFPCSPRDSQESSPTPQFKSINSSMLSFLYSPTLTSIHDYWKNHSLD